MSCIVNKILVDNEDKFSQKCYLPLNLLLSSHIQVGDYVSINCGHEEYICRVFPIVHIQDQCVMIDDTVSYASGAHRNLDLLKENTLTFPSDFAVVKLSLFQKIKVKVVLRDIDTPLVANRKNYQSVVFKILQAFAVTQQSTVKCAGFGLADVFHIHSICILETGGEKCAVGRISRTSNIEIAEVVSQQHLNHMKELYDMTLAGFDDATKLFRSFLLSGSDKESAKVLVTGPSGCGKTVFVKKKCSEFKCNFRMIDGNLSHTLTLEECNAHCKRLTTEVFVGSPTILFIDNIDKLASCDMKHNKMSMLVHLIENLQNANVSIVAAAISKKLLHSVVSRYFKNEVYLGVPTFNQRKDILEVLLKHFPKNQVDCSILANMMPGFLPCDITNLLQKTIKNTNSRCPTVLDFKKVLPSITPSILKTSRWSLKVKPIFWRDIGGMNKIKDRLQMGIEWPLRNPDIFHKVNLPCPHGVLLFGPPGCCKTTLARGLATECKANFFTANPAQIYSPYVGESEKNITELFYQARLSPPSIIFLDELDSLVGKRRFESKLHGIAEKVLSTLLNEMDGFGVRTDCNSREKIIGNNKESDTKEEVMKEHPLTNEVIVVAATNRPDLIDDALLRPGRFDIILYVPPPDIEERKSILETITKEMPLLNVNLDELAGKTELFSGADLKNLCQKAALDTLRKDLSAEHITAENFWQSLKSMQPSISRKQIRMYEQLSSKYGPVNTQS